MTDTDPTDTEKPRWLRDIQEAMERASSAFQAAWESTRDERAAALESAKHAASELGEVFDQGISAARKHWETTPDQKAASEEE